MGRMEKRGGMESLVFLGWLAKEDIESVWWDSPFVTFYCFDNLDEVRHWSPMGLGTNYSLDINEQAINIASCYT